jgi:hypothetical protein
MKTTGILISLFLFIQISFSQEALNRIGQTPGGAAHHVNWIEDQQKLIVGCGASLWVYDMSDLENPHVIAKRAFTQLVSKTDLYGDILFVGAENDGIYALDFNCDSLTVKHQYIPIAGILNNQVQNVFDFARSNDTLFIPVFNNLNGGVEITKYNLEDGFELLSNIQIGANGSRCIAVNERFIAVGKQKPDLEPLQLGQVLVYEREYPYQLIDSHTDTLINKIQKVRFADLNDSIIYVCGGSANAGITSHFLAFHISDNLLHLIDTFSSVQYLAGIPAVGIPGLNAHHFKNMDSRNDTIFLATTAWSDVHNLNLPDEPFSFIPVIDASGLPDEPMEYISFSYGGLWHFDVALMHGTDYLAVASEWAGLLVSDVSSCTNFEDNQPLDTLFIENTGGWAQKLHVSGDTLWVAHEGWGMVAYKTDSLLHSVYGYDTEPKILHIYQLLGNHGPADNHFFVSDFEFIDDTLLYMSSGHVYNIKDWFDGGVPEFVKKDSLSNFTFHLSKINTNQGKRIILGSGVWPLLVPLTLYVYNPYTEELLYEKVLNGETGAICVNDDILFFSYRTTPIFNPDGEVYLVAARIIDNEVDIIIEMPINDIPVALANSEQINAIAYENGIIAIGALKEFRWYEWTGTDFEFINAIYTEPLEMIGQNISDVKIKNNILYGTYKKYGLKIIDISDGTELAYYQGAGGHDGIDGFNFVEIGNDGKIYLTDFYQGVFVIDAYDLTLVNAEQYTNIEINNELFSIYPNPANDYFTVDFTENPKLESKHIKVYDLTGKELHYERIDNRNSITINSETWRAGLYFVSIVDNNRIIKSERIIIK